MRTRIGSEPAAKTASRVLAARAAAAARRGCGDRNTETATTARNARYVSGGWLNSSGPMTGMSARNGTGHGSSIGMRITGARPPPNSVRKKIAGEPERQHVDGEAR